MVIEKVYFYKTTDGALFSKWEDAERRQLELMGANIEAVEMEVDNDFSAFGFKNPIAKYGGRLSIRAINALRGAGIWFIKELTGYRKTDLLKIRTVGFGTLNEICVLAETLKIELGGIEIKENY